MNTSMTRGIVTRPCLTTLVLVFAVGAAAITSPVHAGKIINTTNSGYAIGGYDPVAYFTMGRAVQGSRDIVYEWLGAKWLFANAEHRELFVADSFKYLPQHGGYCSSAAKSGSQGYIDPRAWQIVDGKLYLFYSNRTKQRFKKDDPAVVEADARWEKVKAGLE